MPNPWMLIHHIASFIFWIHMAINPVKMIEVNTAGQATVLEAVMAKHNVETGFVCTSQKDIVCVDGLCNKHGHYWTIELNGNYETVNSQTPVYPSDRLVLKYASSKER